jgi:hypothetical protein
VQQLAIFRQTSVAGAMAGRGSWLRPCRSAASDSRRRAGSDHRHFLASELCCSAIRQYRSAPLEKNRTDCAIISPNDAAWSATRSTRGGNCQNVWNSCLV